MLSVIVKLPNKMKKLCPFISLMVLTVQCFATDVSSVLHPDTKFTGFGSVTFDSDTKLKVEGGFQLQIVLLSYKGEWRDGVAEGSGLLTGHYIIPQSENPTYVQLRSADPAMKGQAQAAIDRVRTNAIFIGQNPDEAEITLLDQRVISITYRGNFHAGMASGSGELLTDFRKLQATFYKWLPEGFGTHMFGDLPVLSETFSRGRPSDGPIVVNLYPAGLNSPSRTFVGLASNSKISGDWFERYWQGEAQDQDFSISGMGNTTTVTYKNGWVLSSEFDSSWINDPQITDITKIRGELTQSLQFADPMYANSPTRYNAIDPEGWHFGYNITGQGPFNQKPAPPYTCSDPQGRPGTLSFPEGCLHCEVTITTSELKWGSKLGRELENIVKDVRNIVVKSIDKVGKAGADTMCDVVQKEPGKNCNVRASVGKSFDIPDSSTTQKQRAQDDLNKFLVAREKLNEGMAPPSMKGQWESAVAIFNACADSGVGPDRAFAMLTVQEIEKTLSAGFEDDIKRYRLASMWSKAWEFGKKYLPGVEYVAAGVAANELYENISVAQWYVYNLERTSKNTTYLNIMQDFLNRLSIKENSRTLLNMTRDGLALYPKIVFSNIPGFPEEMQLGVVKGFGLDPDKFFARYKQFKTSNEVIQAAIYEKFDELKIPRPILH